MGIKFENNTFHLFNQNISYIFTILKNNQLGHLYYGKRITHRANFDYMLVTNSKPNTVCSFEGDGAFSLEYIKQEYPTYGSTDFSEGAYQIKQDNGSIVTNFIYKNHTIMQGKPKLMDGIMPATYVEDESEATTLTITLEDDLLDCLMVMRYTIYEDRDVITRDVKFINKGVENLVLTRALSCCVDFDHKDYELLQLSGAWSRERHIKTRKLVEGIQSISSSRGASSAQQNPFIALKALNTDEHRGEVYGFNLVYSSDFLAQVEVNHYETARLTMGINPFTFEWQLKKGEEFQTPEVVMVYSQNGLNGMSQVFHSLYRERLVRGKWRDESCPILINNWEATYFDFNEDKIIDMAIEAKRLGVELFVLDDGWFGKRNNDCTSLGDWYPDLNKLPNGISGLSKKITDLGLKFGLWFEPEMVNKISDLYKKHPEWIIKTPNRKISHGRNQYVLDFTRNEVIDYLFNIMRKILKKSEISYVKWDMNRNITEPYSLNLSKEQQGELMHRYILGVYQLYHRLTKEFPHILFESCASGGGRFDPGMLYYAPQGWISDDTDAIERLKIQYGTSMIYPLKSMGSHVSAVPNHQVNRITPLDTRGNVAYFGTFGYELDITALSEDEKDIIKKQIEFMKQIRKDIQFGTFYRLLSPFNSTDKVAWMVVSKDQKTAFLGVYQILAKPNPKYDRIKLVGLNPNYQYEIVRKNLVLYGNELMNYGIIYNNCVNESKERKIGVSDFSSDIVILKALERCKR